jgi:hypothetical protein
MRCEQGPEHLFPSVNDNAFAFAFAFAHERGMGDLMFFADGPLKARWEAAALAAMALGPAWQAS